MREEIRDKDRLLHIRDAITQLNLAREQYVKSDLGNEPIVFYGIVKLIEIIGEAAYMLTLEFKEKHPETPWKQIVGMRHVLVHGYYQLSIDDVWDVITNDIPALESHIEKYIVNMNRLNDVQYIKFLNN